MTEKTISLLTIVVVGTIVLAATWYLQHTTRASRHPAPQEVPIAQDTPTPEEVLPSTPALYDFEQAYMPDGLTTNTTIHSQDLAQIRHASAKDSIPALSSPTFTSITEAESSFAGETLGIVVEGLESTKFYPYTILLHHQVINDTIDGTPIVVTFCPLCASAMVFERTLHGEVLTFGVSGKLYESNLLMYDTKTDSLWSQILGTAIVGDKTNDTLTIYPSDVVSLLEMQARDPETLVLSTDTGYDRDYQFNPYTTYDTSEPALYSTPVGGIALPASTIMHVVDTPTGVSVAFDRTQLLEVGSARVTLADGTELFAEADEAGIRVKYLDNTYPEALPGYTMLWFSWAAAHASDGVAWTQPPLSNTE